ncbi:hypothetical protein LCGC14_2558230, partial [marine sediment metagenome]
LDTDAQIYERAELVTISGQAADLAGNPLTAATVSLELTARYGTRRFTATTDDTGSYEWPYRPAAEEAGQYQVVASVSHGDITRTDLATFEIRGLYLQSPRTSMRINAGDQHALTYAILNIGASDLTGLAVSLVDSGGDGGVQATLDMAQTAASLSGGGTTTFTIDLLAEQTLGNRDFQITVTSAEGSIEQAALAVEVVGVQPVIRFDPPNFETVIVNGDRTTQNVTGISGGTTPKTPC